MRRATRLRTSAPTAARKICRRNLRFAHCMPSPRVGLLVWLRKTRTLLRHGACSNAAMLRKLNVHGQDLAHDLRQDHQRLEALLETVRQDVDGPDPVQLQRTWSRFERNLRQHLHEEEQHLLPLLVSSHPEEMRSILSEHRRMREMVTELGAQVDLHSVHKTAVVRLLRMLRVHAKAEERGMYGWLLGR